jgi:hypothetical protein
MTYTSQSFPNKFTAGNGSLSREDTTDWEIYQIASKKVSELVDAALDREPDVDEAHPGKSVSDEEWHANCIVRQLTYFPANSKDFVIKCDDETIFMKCMMVVAHRRLDLPYIS